MGHLVYDVAVTLDGFIARTDGSFQGFALEGGHVAAYRRRLESYVAVIMGRKTYEVGYAFGLQPGQAAYPHMRNVVVSSTLECVAGDIEVVPGDEVGTIAEKLKAESDGDVYLCGGGELAGRLLGLGLIDRLVLKRNPVTFGNGIPLFGGTAQEAAWQWEGQEVYSNGVVCQFFRPGN